MLFQALNRDVFRLKNSKIPSDAVGVEVEMEFTKPFEPGAFMGNYGGWQAKGDGSLRNFGLEFVSKPTSLQDLEGLMDQWGRLLKETPMQNRIDGCPRASVHVHTNVRDYSYNQLMNIIVAYTILEGVMVTFCGKHRKGNLFALRIPEAPYIFDTVRKANREYEYIGVHPEMRYSALNLAALRLFGTLEFRSFGSNYSASEIDLWVRGVRRLVDHAASFSNPPAVYARYVALTKPQFIREFLGALGEEILRRHDNEVEERLNDGEEYAIAFLSSHPDNWTYADDFRDNPEFRKWYNSGMGENPLYATAGHFRSFQKKDTKPLVFDPNQGFLPEQEVANGFNMAIPSELPQAAFRRSENYTTYILERTERMVASQQSGLPFSEIDLVRWVWNSLDLSNSLIPNARITYVDVVRAWIDVDNRRQRNQTQPAPTRDNWVEFDILSTANRPVSPSRRRRAGGPSRTPPAPQPTMTILDDPVIREADRDVLRDWAARVERDNNGQG